MRPNWSMHRPTSPGPCMIFEISFGISSCWCGVHIHTHQAVTPTTACPLFLFASPFTMDLSWQPVTGAAQRRRGRRLRAAWRHEQQLIAQALAAFTHHSAQRQKTARAGEQGHEDKNDAPQRQKPPPLEGSRPPCLGEPRGPHSWWSLYALQVPAVLVEL